MDQSGGPTDRHRRLLAAIVTKKITDPGLAAAGPACPPPPPHPPCAYFGRFPPRLLYICLCLKRIMQKGKILIAQRGV